jgi:hypothetical protein
MIFVHIDIFLRWKRLSNGIDIPQDKKQKLQACKLIDIGNKLA